MHQQVRTKLGKTTTRDGNGAMEYVPIEVDPLEIGRGDLFDLLDLLARRGYNLSLAGGYNIEGGGEFVYSMEDHDKLRESAAVLKAEGYRSVRVVEVHEHRLRNEEGALRDCIQELRDQGRQIDEIHIGAADADGLIPVQVMTIVRRN